MLSRTMFIDFNGIEFTELKKDHDQLTLRKQELKLPVADPDFLLRGGPTHIFFKRGGPEKFFSEKIPRNFKYFPT